MLVGVTAAVGAVGIVGAAVPFVKSWNPSAKAKAAGAPVTADLSGLEPGQQMVVEWRGKPVWVVRRTPEALADLKTVAGNLRDPESKESTQPDFANNEYRSIKKDYLILVGICTHLGCSPLYRPEVAPADLGQSWRGGFFCPCHGSTYDMAGRVYKGVPAPLNLEVPPYKYISDNVVVIGELT
jgi:ubiquinol-cytochrome c reductase iron-sulfur subunit